MSDADDIQKHCTKAMHANADKRFTTKCLACGKSHVRTLRWLQAEKFKCPACGGSIDDKPLHEITLSVLKKMQGGPKNSPSKASGVIRPANVSRPHVPSDYQLVLQFRGDSLDDFEALVALENELIEALGDLADVDGHDIGSGETNIFILTSDPTATFNATKPILQKAKQLQNATAAYRDVNGENYTVIWPPGFKKKFEIL